FGRNSSRPPPSTDALRLKEGPGGQSPIRAGGSCRKRPRGHSARARRRKTRSSQSGPAAGGNEKLSSSTVPQLRKLFVAVNTDRRSSVDLDRLNRHLVGLDFLDKRDVFEILPSVLDYDIRRGRRFHSLRLVSEIEVMQVIASEFVEIVGEDGCSFTADTRPCGRVLTDLGDGLPQPKIIHFIVGEVVAGAAKPERIQIEGVIGGAPRADPGWLCQEYQRDRCGQSRGPSAMRARPRQSRCPGKDLRHAQCGNDVKRGHPAEHVSQKLG